MQPIEIWQVLESIFCNDWRLQITHCAFVVNSSRSLLVEEIDVGDAKLRQVVSGLAKYCSPEELTVIIAA